MPGRPLNSVQQVIYDELRAQLKYGYRVPTQTLVGLARRAGAAVQQHLNQSTPERAVDYAQRRRGVR